MKSQHFIGATEFDRYWINFPMLCNCILYFIALLEMLWRHSLSALLSFFCRLQNNVEQNEWWQKCFIIPFIGLDLSPCHSICNSLFICSPCSSSVRTPHLNLISSHLFISFPWRFVKCSKFFHKFFWLIFILC